MELWSPPTELTRREELLMKRLTRTRKLFGFLRLCRRELFDDAFQSELIAMYRSTGAGRVPRCPAVMAMATLLQGYVGASDAEAVELTVVDSRWQLVLGTLGDEKPAFSQGALVDFRARLIAHDLDRRLLERTAEIARRTGGFDARKLPQTLRVAVDSAPLEGAGRVEDTINLIGHAARKLARCAAKLLNRDLEDVCLDAEIPLLLEPSIKRGLDRTWSDDEDKTAALNDLLVQVDSLCRWVTRVFADAVAEPPLREHLEDVQQFIEQDLEPDPDAPSRRKIRSGVAPDRRVSVEDKEMRHGRKTKARRFDGYKRHIARDVDAGLILACAVAPANRPEHLAADELALDLERVQRPIEQLFIDRAYIGAGLVDAVELGGGEIVCRPWAMTNGKFFAKRDFAVNIRRRTITCPAGQTESITFGSTATFDPEVCDRCELRSRCTDASPGHGRTVLISDNEARQQRLRRLAAMPSGRAILRRRVGVEHSLAHVTRRQGHRARYRGSRKNLFDLRRASAVTNLETIHRSGPALKAA